jgi:DNA mismatch endonuclease, patch repair protein
MPQIRKDRHTPEQRSYNMSRIRSTGSSIELILFELLDNQKIIYTKHPKIFGKPDALIKPNILLFADGDFWHGWHFNKWRENLSTQYWLPKIEKNITRDKKNTRKLRKAGYKVIRIWEHTLKQNPEAALQKIIYAVTQHGDQRV